MKGLKHADSIWPFVITHLKSFGGGGEKIPFKEYSDFLEKCIFLLV